nr:hypothetical protein CFP56_01927 [Quercus suber]
MLDFTFDIKIHVGGCFVEDPTLEYVGGSIHTLTEINPNKLSFFEIRDLCHLVGAPKEHSRYRYLLTESNVDDDLRDIETNVDVVNMTTFHRAWPTNKIIIYIDIDVEPLAVEHPGGGRVVDDSVGGDVGGDGGVDEIDVESNYDEVVLEEEEDDENVEDVKVGDRVEEQDAEVSARVEEQNVEGDDDDDDWLYEGLERDDFGDDIFATPNSTPQGSAPKSSDAPNTAPESSNAPHANP